MLPGFLLFQNLCASRGPPCAAGGSILNSVAAIFILLPILSSIPELAPQTIRSIVQPTANKLFWSGFDLLL